MERVRATVLFVAAAGMASAIAASPAIAQGWIFIRGESHLYAIGARAGS